MYFKIIPFLFYAALACSGEAQFGSGEPSSSDSVNNATDGEESHLPTGTLSSQSDPSGVDTSVNSASTSPIGTTISAEGSEVEVSVATTDSTSISEASSDEVTNCAQALGVEVTSIVDLGSKSQAHVSQNTVLIAVMSGNASIDLNNLQTQSLSGICLVSKGTSNIQIKTSVSFDSLLYQGGGSSVGRINFNGASNLSEVAEVTLSGSSVLSLKGAELDCQNIISSIGNAANFSCMN